MHEPYFEITSTYKVKHTRGVNRRYIRMWSARLNWAVMTFSMLLWRHRKISTGYTSTFRVLGRSTTWNTYIRIYRRHTLVPIGCSKQPNSIYEEDREEDTSN